MSPSVSSRSRSTISGTGRRTRRDPPPLRLPATAERDELDHDIARGFQDLGTRLAASIQQHVLGSLGAATGRATDAAEDASAVDEIADRMSSLGDEIDARVRAALAKKGLATDD